MTAPTATRPTGAEDAPGPGSRVVRADRWVPVCPVDRVQPESGVAVLLEGHQVAVFRLHDGTVGAVDNVDPWSGAGVLSRGIVGTRGDVPVVFSPLHKQAFDLRTGRCLDDPEGLHDLRVWQTCVVDGTVHVGVPEPLVGGPHHGAP